MPYEGGPKSGCRSAEPAWLARLQTLLFGCLGSAKTSMCQTLSAGKTSQLVVGTGAVGPGAARTAGTIVTASAPTTSSSVRGWDRIPVYRRPRRRGLRSVSSLAGGHLLGRDGPRLGEQRLDELVLGHLGDYLATADDEPEPVATRDAHVGLPGLAGPVHHAAHDRDPHRHAELLPFDRGVHLLGQLQHVHLGPAARGAGHEVEASPAQAERSQDRGGGLHLFHGVVGERDADRVADAFGEQRADA